MPIKSSAPRKFKPINAINDFTVLSDKFLIDVRKLDVKFIYSTKAILNWTIKEFLWYLTTNP